METTKNRVVTWAGRGFNIEEGIQIFLSYNHNVFYMNNVRSKPPDEALATLKTEFFFKTGVTVDEQNAIRDAAFVELEEERILEEKIYNDPDLQARIKEEQKERAEREETHVRLREEFPFLNEADCPDEFEDIVQEMVSAYYRYKKKHKLLFDSDPTDLKNCFSSARGVVEPFLQNRLCWRELNHYKLHGEILGEHALFRNKKRYQELKAMNTYELTVYATNNLKRNISYNNSNINRYPDSPKVEMWRDNVRMYELEKVWCQDILKERGELN